MVEQETLINKLSENGLKVTHQRISILSAVYTLDNHPTAEQIIAFVRQTSPTVAVGTVYKVLDTLVGHNLIKRVKTDRDVMRYDGRTDSHHHLYCTTCDIIEDYQDKELDKLLKDYFEKKNLHGFDKEEVIVQVRGKFDKC